MRFIEFPELESTSTYLASIADKAAHGTVVRADVQTAGRGQRGNSWESEPGRNILMSILLRPESLLPTRQFLLSQAVSLAIVDVLDRYLPREKACIKWPNDIYVGDRKICGILIENAISKGRIISSIAGIGINVNQTIFSSGVPNPVSMAQIAGREFSIAQLTREFASEVITAVGRLPIDDPSPLAKNDFSPLDERYFMRLWRRDGYHRYLDRLRDEQITARIDSIAPDGTLTLALRPCSGDNEELRSYAFKEVSAIL